MKLHKQTNQLFSLLFGLVMLLGSCTEIPNLGSIAPDIRYKNRKQFAISGMGNNIGDFSASTSTLPLQFEITSIRELNGGDIEAFNQEIPVIHYNSAIVGNESADELALKTDTVMRPAVSMNQSTGKVEILEGNHIMPGVYHFDINVSNTSGEVLLKDAIIIEFNEFELKTWSAGMKKAPEIIRIADKPNQILFVGHLNDKPLHGDQIDFTTNRSSGFKGTFSGDYPEGELWKVSFPVKSAVTYCSWKMNAIPGSGTTYETENFDFVLGLPGSYIIKLYK